MTPYKEIVFRPIQGAWQDVAGDSGTLAETLERLNIKKMIVHNFAE